VLVARDPPLIYDTKKEPAAQNHPHPQASDDVHLMQLTIHSRVYGTVPVLWCLKMDFIPRW